MGRLNEMAQGAKKGVVNFMLAGDYKEGALAHIDEQHKRAIQKADEKAAKKKEKIEAKEVKKGYECGLTLENYSDIKVGDTLEVYEEVEVKR